MRQTLLAAAAAFVIGGIATGAVLSQAQPVSPPIQQSDAGPSSNQGSKNGPGQHPGWAHHAWMHHGGNLRAFALIYRQSDRQLAPADVQKIAEAFLLWNGNHGWKVTDVAATPSGPIGFSMTTAEGSVVAKFTMDPHSGKVQRVG